MSHLKLRNELWKHCFQILQNKRETLRDALRSLQDSLENETKSSAGDKYETGVEMIQLEKEKLTAQLTVLEGNLQLLESAKQTQSSQQVSAGSLVFTNNGTFFIGPSLGKISLQNEHIYCISPSAPIAQQLIHKKVGEKVAFNGSTIEISSIS